MMLLPQHLPLAVIHRARARAEVEDEVKEVEHHPKMKVQEAKVEREIKIRARVLTKAANHPNEKARVQENPRVNRARSPEVVARNAVLGGTLYLEGFTKFNLAASGPIKIINEHLRTNLNSTDGRTRESTSSQVEKASLRMRDSLLTVVTITCHRSLRAPLTKTHADNGESRTSRFFSDMRPTIRIKTLRATPTLSGQCFSLPSLVTEDIN